MNATVVDVTWDPEATQWQVTISPPGGTPVSHPMAANHEETGADWPMPDPSTRPAEGAGSWDRSAADFRTLAGAVADRSASAAQAEAYGQHLFDALFGPGGRAALAATAAGPPLVVELRWAPGPLHRFVWELMHDGQDYLALRSSAPVVFMRLAGASGAAPAATITRPPRILFAVGSSLDDKEVRAGAEVMGLLRDFEREAGIQGTAVRTRVLTSASLAGLRREYQRFEPDVVHLIGHGRWDARNQLGKLILAADSAGRRQPAGIHAQLTGEEHTAAELATALTTPLAAAMPTMVVVSACEGGVASTGVGLPLGAELAAAGVPIVIAMAGAISDTACRVFTRSVVSSVARGQDLTEALAIGRRAAFAGSVGTPQNIDWALPAVFLRASLPAAYKLADPQAVEGVRAVIRQHGHIRLPLFAGRHELFDDLDFLLRPGNPNVLVLYSTYEQKIGGTRALQELAAEAIRMGSLPVRIGPYTSGDAPRTFPDLALAIAKRYVDLAKLGGVPRPRRTLLLLTGHDPDDDGAPSSDDLLGLPLGNPPADRLVDQLRADVFALRDALAEKNPGVFLSDAAPVLLLDDVHLYAVDAVKELISRLVTTGLGLAPESLPVVLFAKEHVVPGGAEIAKYRSKNRGEGAIRFRELLHVTMLRDGTDGLAYLTWLLNPPRDVPGWPSEVLAPRERISPPQWHGVFRLAMRGRDFYDAEGHQEFADYVLDVDVDWAETGRDDSIMQANGILP